MRGKRGYGKRSRTYVYSFVPEGLWAWVSNVISQAGQGIRDVKGIIDTRGIRSIRDIKGVAGISEI